MYCRHGPCCPNIMATVTTIKSHNRKMNTLASSIAKITLLPHPHPHIQTHAHVESVSRGEGKRAKLNSTHKQRVFNTSVGLLFARFVYILRTCSKTKTHFHFGQLNCEGFRFVIVSSFAVINFFFAFSSSFIFSVRLHSLPFVHFFSASNTNFANPFLLFFFVFIRSFALKHPNSLPLSVLPASLSSRSFFFLLFVFCSLVRRLFFHRNPTKSGLFIKHTFCITHTHTHAVLFACPDILETISDNFCD